MAENFDDLILDNGIDTVNVEMQQADIITALRHDGRFFIQFFLAEELTFDVPKFHLESWHLITDEMILYIALALPRGHAKTTLSKLCCVWYLLFTDTRFIVYVSNTSPIAAEACKDIIGYLLSENYISVFGMPEFEVKQDNHGFYKFWLKVPDGRGGWTKKFCILKALGAGTQVRGLNIDNERPQLAVVDDLEDDENTATPGLQKKMKKWFFGAFMKALSKKRKKIIYLGNMLSNQSILYYLCEHSTQFHSIRYGCLLTNGEPLWKDMWSLEDIRTDFLEYRKNGLTALWFAEMMNMPMVDGTALICPDDIKYVPAVLPGEQENAFITYDPAISQKAWANDSALVVHAYARGEWVITQIVSGKFAPEQIYFLLVDLCLKWNTRCVGIEGGAYEIALGYIFEILAKSYNQTIEFYKLPHKNKSKTERLAAWCAALKQKIWVLQEDEISVTQQLIAYDPSKQNNIDDIIDACSMGITMTACYMPQIMEQYRFQTIDCKPTMVCGN